MKHALKIFILLIGFVLYFNANSFANIDIAAYGGYVLSGDFSGEDISIGGHFGAKAHYNILLSSSMDLGLGAYFQYSIHDNKSQPRSDAENLWSNVGVWYRKAFGLDVNLIFKEFSMPDVYPYVRGTYSFFDKIEGNYETFVMSGKGWGIGGGIEYSISTNVGLFAELMYEKSSYDVDGDNKYFYYYSYPYSFITIPATIDITEITVNVGIKYLIF